MENDEELSMQLGMIGLGRMGGNMVQRLLKGGHRCVVFDSVPANVTSMVEKGAEGSRSLADFIARLAVPRIVWVMVPAHVVDTVLEQLSPHLQAGDIVVDGGNTHYIDDIRRAGTLKARGVHYVDAGVSGGIWGLERGYCLMIGGDRTIVAHLDPIFRTLAPGRDAAVPPAGRAGPDDTASQGYLHCGPAGAGHFVKMVHNGIEYALMAAYAEGFNLLAHANAGAAGSGDRDTTPLARPAALSIRFRAAGDRGAVAAWQRDWLVAARSHRPRAGRGSRAGEVRRPRVGFRRRAMGGTRRDRQRDARARAGGGAVPAIQLARRRQLFRSPALGHAP